MARKLEIYSKTVGGFILHILNILLVIAIVVVASKYFPIRPPNPYSLHYDPSVHESYQAYSDLLRSMTAEYNRFYDINTYEWSTRACLYFCTALHLVYSVTILIAPRFLIKGRVFWKASPWFMSGLGLHTASFILSYPELPAYIFWTLMPISTVIFLGLFAGIFLHVAAEASQFLRPYVFERVDNILAGEGGIENSRFGPAIPINNNFNGQPPVVMRYGSQAFRA